MSLYRKNNLRLKILLTVTYFTTFFWTALGIITIGSIYLSRIGVIYNLIGGMFFVLIGGYFYFKEKALSELLEKTLHGDEQRLAKKVFLGEVFFVLVALLVGVILLSGAFSRVFREGYAVFG